MRLKSGELLASVMGSLLLAGCVADAGPAASAAPAAFAVPAPALARSPAGTHGFPYLSETIDLAARGYVEEEVIFSGTARSYVPLRPLAEIGDGRWDASATGPTAPFVSRMLIRRPTNPAKFNGTVIVDWMNVSGGFDTDSFTTIADMLMREGYAYVGVSAQKVGVDHLLKWETGPGARYASVNHPGDSWSYDIFSQAARAVRAPAAGGPAPLGTLTPKVRMLVATGGSQSGARLITYINAVHPTAGVFDAFMPTVAANGSALAQAPLIPIPVPTGPRTRIRLDSDEPVLIINSESEFPASARGLHAQSDGGRYRLWELAGVSHATAPTMASFGPKAAKAGLVFPGSNCADPPLNDVDNSVAARAAHQALRRWVLNRAAPRSAPRAELAVPADAAAPATVVRDPATGLARGGLRLPDVAAPTRTLAGMRPPGETDLGCRLGGASDPWNGEADRWDKDRTKDPSPATEPNLVSLYRTNAGYVAAVRRSADALVAQGFLRREDAAALVAKARGVAIR